MSKYSKGFRKMREIGTITLTLTLLAGCAGHAPPKADETVVKQFAGRGYLSDDHYGIATSFATWGRFDVALTVPAKPGPFPLVIYLPALGETRAAGNAWQSAWAQSGYAVLSLQPLAQDALAWSSAQARTGDFATLARERYSGIAMTARLEALSAAMTELIRRQGAKEAPLDRIDLTRVAIAGYDLGAYTAMVVAGENLRSAEKSNLPLPVAAVIALSPYADFSGASFGERYGAIHGPVLAVTSDYDVDSVGLVTSSSIRKAPFEYMPAGGKYLLTLTNVPHRVFAGGELEQADEEKKSGGEGEPSKEGGHGAGRHKKNGNTGESGNAGAGARDGAGSPGGGQLSPTSQALGVTMVQGVTAAFLDAYVKNDAIAREWLDKDAPRWIKDRGEIKRK